MLLSYYKRTCNLEVGIVNLLLQSESTGYEGQFRDPTALRGDHPLSELKRAGQTGAADFRSKGPRLLQLHQHLASTPGIYLNRAERNNQARLTGPVIAAHINTPVLVAEPHCEFTTRVRAEFGTRPYFKCAVRIGRVEYEERDLRCFLHILDLLAGRVERKSQSTISTVATIVIIQEPQGGHLRESVGSRSRQHCYWS